MIEALSGATLVRMQTGVKRSKKVRLKFNFVSDTSGHATTRNAADVLRNFATAKWMYRAQTNVSLESLGTAPIAMAQDLGPVVGSVLILPALPRPNTNMVGRRDNAADLNFFFVWEYEQDDSPGVDDANAGTLGGNCIYEDDIGAGIPLWRTMSHEIGHPSRCR